MVASVFGRYELLDQVGTGSAHTVWRATDQQNGRESILVAVPEDGADPEHHSVEHPNLLRFRDLGAEDGKRWAAVTDQDLVALSARTAETSAAGRDDGDRVLGWGADVADALAAWHRAGLVHGGLSADAVWVRPSGHAALLAIDGADDGAVTGAGSAADVAALAGTISRALRAVDAPVPPAVARAAESSGGSGDSDVSAEQLRDAMRAAPRTATGTPAGGTETVVVDPARSAGSTASSPADTTRTVVTGGSPGDATQTVVTRGGAHAPPWSPAPVPPQQAHAPRRPVPRQWSPPPGGPGRGPAARPPGWHPGPPPPGQHHPYASPYPGQNHPGQAYGAPYAPAPPRRRRGRTLAIVGVAVVLVAALVAVTVFLTVRGQETTATPAVPPPPASALGDLRTVDPCSLAPAASLQRYGPAAVVQDYGTFPSCNIQIGDAVFVSVEAEADGEYVPTAVSSTVGDVNVARPAPTATMCVRRLVEPDRSAVGIFVYQTAEGSDLCGIADAVVGTALPTMVNHTVGRRSVDPTSVLAPRDACGLVDPSVATQLPGVDLTRVAPGAGGWTCRYGYQPALAAAPYADVIFSRLMPFRGPTTQIAGRTASVSPDPDTASCAVFLVQRSFLATDGNRRNEVLETQVFNRSRPDAACAQATALAASIAPKLPPPS